MVNDVEKVIREAANYIRRELEKERQNIPPEYLQQGDEILDVVFQKLIEFTKLVGKTQGVTITDNDAVLPAILATSIASIFVEMTIRLYIQGMDIDMASAIAIAATLNPQMAINVTAHVDAAVRGGAE